MRKGLGRNERTGWDERRWDIRVGRSYNPRVESMWGAQDRDRTRIDNR